MPRPATRRRSSRHAAETSDAVAALRSRRDTLLRAARRPDESGASGPPRARRGANRSVRHTVRTRNPLARTHRGRREGGDVAWDPVTSSESESSASSTSSPSSSSFSSCGCSSDEERIAPRRQTVSRMRRTRVVVTRALWDAAGPLLRRMTHAAAPSMVPPPFRVVRVAAVAAAAAIAESSESEVEDEEVLAWDTPVFYGDDIIEPQGVPPDTPYGTWHQGGGPDNKYRLIHDGTLDDTKIGHIQTLLSDLRVRREEAASRREEAVSRKRPRDDSAVAMAVAAAGCSAAAAAAAAAAVSDDAPQTPQASASTSSVKRPRVPMCVACQEAFSTRILEPCGHFYTCDACTARSPPVTACPYCRATPVTLVIPQFE